MRRQQLGRIVDAGEPGLGLGVVAALFGNLGLQQIGLRYGGLALLGGGELVLQGCELLQGGFGLIDAARLQIQRYLDEPGLRHFGMLARDGPHLCLGIAHAL